MAQDRMDVLELLTLGEPQASQRLDSATPGSTLETNRRDSLAQAPHPRGVLSRRLQAADASAAGGHGTGGRHRAWKEIAAEQTKGSFRHVAHLLAQRARRSGNRLNLLLRGHPSRVAAMG